MGARADRDGGSPHDDVGRVQRRQHRQAELSEQRVGDRIGIVHRRPVHDQRARGDDPGQPEQRQHTGRRGAHRVGQPARKPKVADESAADPRTHAQQRAREMDAEHAEERAQRVGRLQFGDDRRGVVDDGQRDGREQQRTAERRRHHPPHHEPRCARASRRGRRARRAPDHQQHGKQRHDTELAARDGDRHLMHAEPHARDGAERARHVAVGDHQLQQHDRRDDHQRDHRRAERDPEQVTGLSRAYRPVVH